MSADPPAGLLQRGWRYLKITAVVLFVCWQLFFLVFRNPLDLWWDDTLKDWCQRRSWWRTVRPEFERFDTLTRHYGNACGVEQGWCMFTPPMARKAPFLAARLEFSDGSEALLLSENEVDPARPYLRVGGWRQRKLEDILIGGSPRTLADNVELSLWQAYARDAVRRWHQQHPDDPRTVTRVRLEERRFAFPRPGSDPHEYADPLLDEVGTFDADGRLLP
jgi:hypothetical protein